MKKTALIAALLMLFTSAAPSAFAETTVDTILTAGTTQAFTDEAVPDEDVQTILRAGLASESAINQQPWFFVAVTDKAVMEELSSFGGMPPMGGAMPPAANDQAPNGPAPAGAAPSGDGPKDMPAPMMTGGAKAALGDSPLAILIYMDESSKSPNPSFDCGLAVQNMYIAAVSLGYGAKVISSPTMTLNGENHDQICEQLGVDSSMTAAAVLLIGKRDETVDSVTGATTRADLDSKVSIIG